MKETGKKDIFIFLAAIVMIGATFAGGVFYLKIQARSSDLLASLTAVAQPQSLTTGIVTGAAAAGTGSAVSSSDQEIPPAPLTMPYSLAGQGDVMARKYWPKGWGQLSLAGGVLTLTAATDTNGASTFLSGASSWTNYAVSADADRLSGGWFDIAARVAGNTQDLVYCDFGPQATAIIERVNGVDTQVAWVGSSGGATAPTGMGVNYGMDVYGNSVACLVSGKEIVGASVSDGEESAGGIGFIAWNQLPGTSQVRINEISVTPLARNSMEIPFPPPPPAPAVAVAIPATTTAVPAAAPVAAPSEATGTPVSTALALPYLETNFAGDANWKVDWGKMTVDTSGSIEMAAGKNNTGGTILLLNSQSWTNYTFDTAVDWAQGETFGLLARYRDSQNYTECYFDETDPGDVKMELFQYVDGEQTVLETGYLADYQPPHGSFIDASIQVVGGYGTCILDNYQISNKLAGTYEIYAPSGGIGFTMYDPTPDTSALTIKSVSVNPAD